ARSSSERARNPKARSRHGANQRGFMSCLDDRTILDLIRGGLDDVARRRVEDELARCGRCAALVGALLREGSAPRIDAGATIRVSGEAGPAEPAGDDSAGARYTLGEVIARGGMGTIVSAFDNKLARKVAVKCLDSENGALTTRFAREIRVTAQLQH